MEELRAVAQDPRTELWTLLWEGRPAGLVQAYPATQDGQKDYYNLGDTDGVWATDQFIGEPDLIGRGVGTALLKAFTEHLLARPGVRGLITDPAPDNLRAIRCYEKAGYRQIPGKRTVNGDLVMILDGGPRYAAPASG